MIKKRVTVTENILRQYNQKLCNKQNNHLWQPLASFPFHVYLNGENAKLLYFNKRFDNNAGSKDDTTD